MTEDTAGVCDTKSNGSPATETTFNTSVDQLGDCSANVEYVQIGLKQITEGGFNGASFVTSLGVEEVVACP